MRKRFLSSICYISIWDHRFCKLRLYPSGILFLASLLVSAKKETQRGQKRRATTTSASPVGFPIQKYIEKKGGGMHHLCFSSDNIEEDIARLKSKGYEFLSEAPYLGAHNCMVIFRHPKSCDGVLIELNQPQDDAGEH